MRGRLLALVFALVLAGCVGAPTAQETSGDASLGEVEGISHDTPIDVTAEDGFNATERELLVTRSMARIEVVRGLEFERTVEVEVITREELGDRRGETSVDRTHADWNNQVWEGLFIIGEDRNVSAVFDEAFGVAVQGYYDTGEERIVLVSDEAEPTIDKQTLVHELVHALQDQHFGLGGRPTTQDADLARDSVVEGEAELVPELYLDRCGVEWDCVRPETSLSGGDSLDQGVVLTILQPYTSGTDFVSTVKERGGWDAVDGLHEDYPDSTRQVIHPEGYPDIEPVTVTVADRSSEEWSRFDHDPVGDRVGEASLYVMFLTNGVIESDDVFGYRHPVTEGWAGDRLVPYRTGDGEFGYVWELEWETEDDAKQFRKAYLDMLESYGGQERGADSYLVSEGSFADAFRVTQDGTTVRIVNGPDVESLRGIHDN